MSDDKDNFAYLRHYCDIMRGTNIYTIKDMYVLCGVFVQFASLLMYINTLPIVIKMCMCLIIFLATKLIGSWF